MNKSYIVSVILRAKRSGKLKEYSIKTETLQNAKRQVNAYQVPKDWELVKLSIEQDWTLL